MLEAIHSFFDSSSMLREINSTYIALVPKNANPSQVKDYRPISCCNTIYKCISKVLANRMKTCLPFIISSNQSAFVPGRLMAENILVAHEIVKGYSCKRISPRCSMKVDIMKAFDTISWDFIRNALYAFGFPSNFTDWIMACITTTSFTVAINGSFEGFFQGGSGIRQGDPISPYIFVICMQVLTSLLNGLKNVPGFSFHPHCDKIKLNHLCFADDLFIFCKGNLSSLTLNFSLLSVD